MTSYELLAITISLIALFMPLIKKIYIDIFYKNKINFYPNGQIILFFNQSGSYFRIYGTYESINSSSLIRSINVKIARKSDNLIINYPWSSFISPVIQNISNTSFIDAREIAHPIVIPKNSIYPAFIEFSDPSGSADIIIKKIINEFMHDIKIDDLQNYNILYNEILGSHNFNDAKRKIAQEFIWKIGSYNLTINVEYNSKSVSFSYLFEISENDYNKLYKNIDEALIYDIKKLYNQNIYFYTANIQLYPNKNKY